MNSHPGDPDGRGDDRGPVDPERRRPRSLRTVVLIVGGVIIFVLAVWFVLYFTASETAENVNDSLAAIVDSVAT